MFPTVQETSRFEKRARTAPARGLGTVPPPQMVDDAYPYFGSDRRHPVVYDFQRINGSSEVGLSGTSGLNILGAQKQSLGELPLWCGAASLGLRSKGQGSDRQTTAATMEPTTQQLCRYC